MLNINLGHNRELMERCGRLKEQYAQFISCVRDYMNSGLEQVEAVAQAVDSCLQSGILADLLAKHKVEIKGKQVDIFVLLEDLGTIPDSIQAIIHEQKIWKSYFAG